MFSQVLACKCGGMRDTTFTQVEQHSDAQGGWFEKLDNRA